ncbi:MAG: 4-alpha-glucanotransferase, partial [Clostridia bacterium]|nr:4-alpha-glucanotransferase [Clostridia bacterium]
MEKAKEENFFKRSSGVLLNVSSLPSPFGIGTLGKGAYEFVDFLKECGFSYWQILPLNPVGAGNSPYSSPSAFAGNVLYIDPQFLFEEGYIKQSTLNESYYGSTPYTADYDFVKSARSAALEEAYRSVKGKDIRQMCEDAGLPDEIFDYAKYKAVKAANENTRWQEWTTDAYDEEVFESVLFSQYLFFDQWKKLKKYANGKGIKIIGDMPIYVSMESSDVWAHKELFLLNENNKPEKVAGVPPDYFSEDGQFWGNPLYNWKKH